MSTLKILAAGMAAAVSLATPGVASAQRAPASETVSHADLDLSNPSDANQLMSRIHGAVRRVCAEQPGAPPLREVRRCMNDTLEQTLAGLDPETREALNRNRPLLASYRRVVAAR